MSAGCGWTSHASGFRDPGFDRGAAHRLRRFVTIGRAVRRPQFDRKICFETSMPRMAFFGPPDDRTYSDKSVTCVPGPCGAVCVSVQSSCVQCGLSAWVEIVAQVVTARDWGHLPVQKHRGEPGHTGTRITQTSTGTGEKGTGTGTLRASSTPVALTLPHSSPATDIMFALCVSSHCFL